MESAIYTQFGCIVPGAIAEWESYTGDATLWDEESWVGRVTGCSSGPITE
ncbi:MAG TPA: hypothetical protein VFS30_03015 [Dehalococcoidia bacterium]|nr:hypothetical protein [Dehalococcoidia bacterium]